MCYFTLKTNVLFKFRIWGGGKLEGVITSLTSINFLTCET